MKSITETLNGKIQTLFIEYGVHVILDADETAELTEEIIELFSKTIRELVGEEITSDDHNSPMDTLLKGRNGLRSEILSKWEDIRRTK